MAVLFERCFWFAMIYIVIFAIVKVISKFL